jgi:protein-S-isoprenylcysteine O-methyltransferase Ste14
MVRSDPPSDRINHKQGVIRWIVTSIIFLLLVAASLFISAGTIDWQMAWIYLAIAVVIQILDAIILIPTNPELLGERSKYQRGVKKWDQFLSRIMATIGPLTIWIISGLDYRFTWSSPYPTWIVIRSAVLVFAGGLLVLWAMASNRFFIGMVRIQEERGHIVIKSGPYQYIRHPGYLGSIVFLLFTPLTLGSWWALIPAVLTCCVVILRTHLEDNTLKNELVGYREYSQEVRFRLLPAIW